MGLTVLLIGVLVFIGWLIDSAFLKSILDDGYVMKTNAAVAFILTGASILALRESSNASRRNLPGQIFAALVAFIGVVTLAEHAFNFNAGIDELLFAESPNVIGTFSPNRMAPSTSVGFAATGVSLLLIHRNASFLIAQMLMIGVSLIGWLNFTTSIYKADFAVGVASLSFMAVHASVGFICIGIASVFAQPRRGIAAMLLSETIAGKFFRYFLPLIIILPLFLGWIRKIGYRAQLFDVDFGLVVFTIVLISIQAAGLYMISVYFQKSELERMRAVSEVQKLNEVLEQRVRDRTAEIESVNKELEAFSYSVSHDLRAPIRHIDSYTGLLKKQIDGGISESAARYLSKISNSATQMGLLIDNLLVFSRMSRAELSMGEVSLNAIVKEVLHTLEPDMANRSIDWRIHPLPKMHGDMATLRQVFINLISNAIKYTRENPHAVIEIGSREEERETIFFVKDNGVGFDMQFAPKLFGVFQRLHSVRQFEGTGIGLANVRRIIQRHGGKVWAEGKVQEGATFYFSLPKIGIPA